MALKIKANSFFMARFLRIDSGGVTFCETAGFGGTKKFSFQQIECVLLAPDSTLSFQVGNQVFSLPVNLNRLAHRQVIDTLLQQLRHSEHAGYIR